MVASNWCCRDKPFIAKVKRDIGVGKSFKCISYILIMTTVIYTQGMKEKEKLFITEKMTERTFLEDKKLDIKDPDW